MSLRTLKAIPRNVDRVMNTDGTIVARLAVRRADAFKAFREGRKAEPIARKPVAAVEKTETPLVKAGIKVEVETSPLLPKGRWCRIFKGAASATNALSLYRSRPSPYRL
jgi:hypothetical protein